MAMNAGKEPPAPPPPNDQRGEQEQPQQRKLNVAGTTWTAKQQFTDRLKEAIDDEEASFHILDWICGHFWASFLINYKRFIRNWTNLNIF